MSNFRIEKPFETNPPRLKDLVNEHVMGDVWIRDTPFGPVTDSLKIAEHFDMTHFHTLRAIDKCFTELSIQSKLGLNKNFIKNNYLGGAKGKERKTRKVDIKEFGLMLLLLYINTPKARMISAEILYRFFILKSYVGGLSENQIGALKGYYRKRMKD
jgi:phage regulator Rha-like protein